jgi:hypothetical protein
MENKELIEEWKPVERFESLYQVSNIGRVKSLGRIGVKSGNIKPNIWKERILSGYSKSNYPKVGLRKDGIQTTFNVHYLVAKAFVANPNNKPFVNHKDGVRSNNNFENLEWVTHQENMKHAYSELGRKGCNFERKGNMCKSICQYNLNGDFIKQWDSTQQIEEVLGLNDSAIANCCRGENKSSFGFIWKYEFRPLEKVKELLTHNPEILQAAKYFLDLLIKE